MSKEMGTTLQQTLRGLCSNTRWNYAVFWKLKHGTRMILAWEDGYYQYAKTSSLSNVSPYMVQGFPLKGMEFGQEGVHAQNGFSVGDQIGLAVAQMSYQVYLFGEGIIGSVALTGKHNWIFGDKNCINGSSSVRSVYGRVMLEYPIGWQNQFAAGIKTIAVISVMPHGVIQLGSTQMIMEDLEFVNRVQDVFGIFQNVPKTFFPDSKRDGLSGKIQESFLPKKPIVLTSPGNAVLSGRTNIASFEDVTNKSVIKRPSSDILSQFMSPANLIEKNKNMPTCTLALPSMESVGASTGTLNHQSSLQQNDLHLNNLLAHITDIKGTEIVDTRVLPPASRVYPFEGQMPVNVSLPASHQTLIMGSGNTCMEQLQFQGKMTLDFQEDCILDSICGSAERLCQDSFNIAHKDDRILETAVDVQPPVSVFQDSGGQSRYPSVSAGLLASNINKTKMDTTPMPVLKVDPENICYSPPSLSSSNIGMTVFDPSQSSDAPWSVSAGHPNTTVQKRFSNGLANSLGYEEISMSNTLGIDLPSWHKEIIAKDMPEALQNNAIHSVNPVKESALAELGKFSAIVADFDSLAGNELDNSENCRNPPSKVQHKAMHDISCIPSNAELLEALRPAFKKGQDNGASDETIFHGDVCSRNLGTQNFGLSHGSDYHSEVDVTKKSDASIATATEGWYSYETNSEELLDAVVASRCLRTHHGGDENVSSKTTFSSTTNMNSVHCASAKFDNCSEGQLSSCEKKQSKVLDNPMSRENLDLGNCTNPSFSSLFHDVIGLKMSPNESSTNAQRKSLVNETQCENQGLAQVKRPGEPIKVNRKRAKPGESTRPRPKDRQQIQDRLKELREIIPNGAKCSIDILLERTIKHMHFLQSVTKYADKLKLTGKSKVLDDEDSLLATNMEGGASWAYEVGGQTAGCPVIVENLNQPRQMLVEMLCEERGLFLEIADIIRSLGLTILKGVMESRKDKVWARFVVEANRDVHRVEVLWSLIQLLQPKTNQSSIVTPQGH